MSLRKRVSKSIRWGRLAEIDRRLRVGTKNWNALPLRLRHLSSWRADHLVGSHKSIRSFARYKGKKPSSDIVLTDKINYFKKRKK